MIALLLATALQASEADYWAVDYLRPPDGERVEVGGMGLLPDGRLALSTRRGEVWLVEDPLADDPTEARFHKFAEGLHEGLGLAVEEDGTLLVLQRGELSRLRDTDGDGRCDRIDVVANDWGLSDNYHEFAFGLPSDAAGNRYLSLNLAFVSPRWWHGQSLVPWRGWVMRLSPEGVLEPFAMGFRSPCGLGSNAAGDIFATDNQGDWMPACPIAHVKEGRFYGHPASLAWLPELAELGASPSDTVPTSRERAPVAAWIPYEWSRSTGNLVHDSSAGRFGPFADQLLVGEITNGMVLRAQLEEVRGEYQGAVFKLREDVGSVSRVLMAPDGTLLCGFTNRGWGGLDPADGVARLRWTGRTPMEVERVHLVDDGFELTFTLPLAEGRDLSPGAVRVEQYDYNYWWEYGSPEQNRTPVAATAVELSDDRRVASVRLPGLRPAMVARVRLTGVVGEGDEPLLHEEFAYTINQLPSGPATELHVAKVVAPPEARESGNEGQLWLTYGDAFDSWVDPQGWELCDVGLDLDDRSRFEIKPGFGALVNTGDEPSDLVTRFPFGDVDAHIEFFLPEGGQSALYLMDRYGLLLSDDGEACASILPAIGTATTQRPPDRRGYKGPGRWHKLDVRFRAPRFDAEGDKTADAVFERVRIDDVLLHEAVSVPGPSAGSTHFDEVAEGPLRVVGTEGSAAFRVARVRGTLDYEEGEGWERIFDGEGLEGWQISDGGQWRVEDGAIVGTGPRSHLFSPRGDYTDLELRARVKINEGGNSGMYFRVAYGPAWPDGYEAQVNSTHSDPTKTGSLYGRSLVKTQLVEPGTWFTQHITCRDTDEGVHITIRVNGQVFVDHVDTERSFASGHVAFQQHHEGSEVRYKDVEVRELR